MLTWPAHLFLLNINDKLAEYGSQTIANKHVVKNIKVVTSSYG